MNTVFKHILCLTACFLLVMSSAQAETNRVVQNSPSNYKNNAGDLTTLDLSFDNETNKFRFFTRFDEVNGVIPDGFWLVVNGTGANPKGYDGELAIFFFDSSDPSNPVLTVYSYSGKSNGGIEDGGSFIDGSKASGTQAPDKILTSLDSETVAKYDIQLSAFPSENGDFTFLGFSLDSTLIQDHMPKYASNNDGEVWQGAQFENKLGYWFHAISGTNITYAEDGYLVEDDAQISFKSRSIYDLASIPTFNETPSCEVIGASVVTTEIGQRVGFQVRVTDPQRTIPEFTITGAPEGAEVTQVLGEGQDSSLNVFLSYTTSAADEGEKYSINFNFMDDVMAQANCPVRLNVNTNDEPESNIFDAGILSNVSCATEVATVVLDGSASFDANSAPQPALNYAWTTTCPDAVFSNAMAASTELKFLTFVENKATGCTATLTVSDGQKSDTDTIDLSVADCQRDCAGNINGAAVVDKCGVCDGADADLDRCGICNGDGESCLDCASSNQAVTITELDSLLFQASRDVFRIVRSVEQSGLRVGKKLRKRVEAAQVSYESGWVAVNSLPVNTITCENTQFCVAVNFAQNESDYLEEAEDILKTLKRVKRVANRKLRKDGVRKVDRRRLVRRPFRSGKNAIKAARNTVGELVTTTDVCQ